MTTQTVAKGKGSPSGINPNQAGADAGKSDVNPDANPNVIEDGKVEDLTNGGTDAPTKAPALIDFDFAAVTRNRPAAKLERFILDGLLASWNDGKGSLGKAFSLESLTTLPVTNQAELARAFTVAQNKLRRHVKGLVDGIELSVTKMKAERVPNDPTKTIYISFLVRRANTRDK